MKFLVISDIHGDSAIALRAAERSEKEKVDAVIIAGDITNYNMEFENIIKPFKEKGKQVMIIPGNHESIDSINLIAQYYGIKNIHGCPVKFGDIGIVGIGGATTGPFYRITESRISELLKKGFDDIKDCKKKLLITHIHPKNTLMEKLSNLVSGSKALTEGLYKYKPNFLLCGHIHEASGLEEKIGDTTAINVSRKEKIIEL